MVWNNGNTWKGMWTNVWVGFWKQVGIICDFSTYFNGTRDVIVPFVKRAPLNINTTGSINDAIQADISFDPTVDEEFIFTTRLVEDTGITDKMVILYDSGSSSLIQFVMFTGPSSFFRVQGFNGTSNSFSDSDDDLVFGDKYELGFKLSGPANAKVVTCTVNGVDQSSPDSLDFTGVTFDKIVIGSGADLSDILKLLAFNVSSTQLGNVNFVSNVDDGLTFISTSGDTYIASDQSPLTIQFPDYTPVNSIDILSDPATGPLNLDQDSVSNELLPSLINLDQDFVLKIRFNLDVSIDPSDRILRLKSTLSDSGITLDWSGSIIRLFIADSIGINQANMSRSYTLGTDGVATITRVGSSVTFDVNGSSTTDATVDLTTNGSTINIVHVGAENVDFREAESLFYYFNMDILDNWNFVGRLPTQNDATGNTFTGSLNSIILTLQDDIPFGAYFPYLTDWNDSYLISDTPCPENTLILSAGVATFDEATQSWLRP